MLHSEDALKDIHPARLEPYGALEADPKPGLPARFTSLPQSGEPRKSLERGAIFYE